MGKFAGDAAGILMIALIVVLMLKFICDILKTNEQVMKNTVKSIGLYASVGLLSAMAIMIFGGIIFNFREGRTSLLNYEAIWCKGMVEPFITTSELGGYSLSLFGEMKMFPPFPMLITGLARLLFNMYRECGLYISLLSGVVTTVCLGLIIEKKHDHETAVEYILLLLCIPGIVYLFLPSTFAMWAALFSATVVCMLYGKNRAALVLGILCVFAHLFGVAALVAAMYGMITKNRDKKVFIMAGILSLSVLIVMALFGFVLEAVQTSEILLGFLLPVSLLVPKASGLKYVNFNYAKMMMIMLSGFHIVCLMYGAF